jgi:hypothetical protein
MRVDCRQEFVIGVYTVGGHPFDALVFGYYRGNARLEVRVRIRGGDSPQETAGMDRPHRSAILPQHSINFSALRTMSTSIRTMLLFRYRIEKVQGHDAGILPDEKIRDIRGCPFQLGFLLCNQMLVRANVVRTLIDGRTKLNLRSSSIPL